MNTTTVDPPSLRTRNKPLAPGGWPSLKPDSGLGVSVYGPGVLPQRDAPQRTPRDKAMAG